MKRFLAAILAFGVFSPCVSTASACCLWPFGGGWGAGYGGGYYGASYAPYVPSSGYYSAGYAPSNCCVPVCCDPCASGACSSGSCVGTTPAGSLKPESDLNFDKGAKDKNTYDEFDRDRLKRREEGINGDLNNEPNLDTRTRDRVTDPDPVDDFRSSPMGGRGIADDSQPFGTDNEQINKKPPMEEPGGELPAVDPVADPAVPNLNDAEKGGSTFLDEDAKKAGGDTRLDQRQLSLTERPSGFSEVVTPKRLASRSLPSTGSRGKTSFAGKSLDDKAKSSAPVRWISLPMPEGNARL